MSPTSRASDVVHSSTIRALDAGTVPVGTRLRWRRLEWAAVGTEPDAAPDGGQLIRVTAHTFNGRAWHLRAPGARVVARTLATTGILSSLADVATWIVDTVTHGGWGSVCALGLQALTAGEGVEVDAPLRNRETDSWQ
ncbi:hypothetical protein GCM10010988_40190 [Cnuibacter physcomitrellae]|uniref:Uncharacterized protein n=1 Tax=Cnuibacter physcomitrellae TaxID=1619308 RepID=A0A1X9LUH3_9MICO|nr:hypothetical protein [Cnuibacter physcomitrellae]ARJ07661.1 hypothetical protein B5808_19995 [Cnuibacter physcomitrellae]GGI42668.1 hypothetical protein GCM10010988_40190 [Cnuibacter physcomitrellae]